MLAIIFKLVSFGYSSSS